MPKIQIVWGNNFPTKTKGGGGKTVTVKAKKVGKKETEFEVWEPAELTRGGNRKGGKK